MKMIAALVQSFMLSKVTHALEEIDGFPGMTVTDARGFGREKSTHEEGAPHRVIEAFVEYVKKARKSDVGQSRCLQKWLVESALKVPQ